MTDIKELWLADKDQDASIYRIRSNGKFLFEIHDPLNTGIARRVVACVNACKSIDTALLERINKNSVLGIHPRPQERIEVLEQQRDELLASLKRIRGMTDADDPGSYRSDDREGCLDAVFSEALEAIAEIEAAQS